MGIRFDFMDGWSGYRVGFMGNGSRVIYIGYETLFLSFSQPVSLSTSLLEREALSSHYKPGRKRPSSPACMPALARWPASPSGCAAAPEA